MSDLFLEGRNESAIEKIEELLPGAIEENNIQEIMNLRLFKAEYSLPVISSAADIEQTENNIMECLTYYRKQNIYKHSVKDA